MTAAASPRYAVYFALPRENGLWRLAQAWLGRDCETGESLAQPVLDGWPADVVAEVTASPRHYGFHATLKAPFRLAEEKTPQDLRENLIGFAGKRRAFSTSPLKVSAIGPFLALTLAAPSPEMTGLADAAVTELDPLRAPLDEGEIQRRLGAGLTARQEELLRRWGYPYVEEEFRFHMTLTGPIAERDKRQALHSALQDLFEPLLGNPVPVGEVCLYSQAAKETPFTLAERFRFAERGIGSEGEAAATQGRTAR
ncbi:MAG: DUF1045 domain-containing protein [Kiloniellaceae bacterium]